MMRSFSCFLFLALAGMNQANAQQQAKAVTCGSAIKLTHVESGSNHYLHSEDKNLGSGSGQQIVTWVPEKSSTTALWWVREPHPKNQREEDATIVPCSPGTPIRCGDTIRLTHLSTKRNLHSHTISSPLSRQQEVSGYGSNGEGDSADNWIVECSSNASPYWMRDTKVRLLHVDTGKYLAGSANVKYTAQNCGHGCPILHHLEAFGRKQRDDYSFVKVEMGVLLSS